MLQWHKNVMPPHYIIQHLISVGREEFFCFYTIELCHNTVESSEFGGNCNISHGLNIMTGQESRSHNQKLGQLISNYNFTSKTVYMVQISRLYIKGQES
jgi:hypothetical protein